MEVYRFQGARLLSGDIGVIGGRGVRLGLSKQAVAPSVFSPSRPDIDRRRALEGGGRGAGGVGRTKKLRMR